MSDALQAAADIMAPSDLSDPKTIIAAFLSHPDVAGCDCDDGYAIDYTAFSPGTCDQCVQVTVGGVTARVRRDRVAEGEDDVWLLVKVVRDE